MRSLSVIWNEADRNPVTVYYQTPHDGKVCGPLLLIGVAGTDAYMIKSNNRSEHVNWRSNDPIFVTAEEINRFWATSGTEACYGQFESRPERPEGTGGKGTPVPSPGTGVCAPSAQGDVDESTPPGGW